MLKNKNKEYEYNQSPFYNLKSKNKLAKLLNISTRLLKSLASSKILYLEKDIFDSNNNKYRHIEQPCFQLKQVQKRIEKLLQRIEIPSYVHAPAQGRSYISNAKTHLGASIVRSLDIREFFASTPTRRVYWFFHKQMKCSNDIAGILAQLLTFKNHLPTGSPSSPILSYFAYIDMWEAINKIVEESNCILTIYIDDITISGSQVTEKLIWQIKAQLRRFGLQDNPQKEKYYFGKKNCEITGIILDKNTLKIKIPNRQHKKIYDTHNLIKKETDPDKLEKLKQKAKGLESQKHQIQKANILK